MELKYSYIAFDQYGQHVWIVKHPRKELMQHVGVQSAQKMYVDDKDGGSHHIGYVVGGRWFDVLRVAPWH